MHITQRLEEAIQAYKNGDEDAFLVIREESEDYVSKCVESALKEQADNETMDEVYREIKEKLYSLNNPDSFYGWVSFVVNQKLKEEAVEETEQEVVLPVKVSKKSNKKLVMVVAIAAVVLLFMVAIVLVKPFDKKGIKNNRDVIYEEGDVFEQTIPEGCQYYSNKKNVFLQAGEKFPEVGYNDKYITKDYTYTKDIKDEWTVVVNDKNQVTYEDMLSEIRGVPVVNLSQVFERCVNMKETPIISSNATDLMCAFWGCKSLEKVTMLPDTVTNMHATFSGCENLKEVPNIPKNVIDMSNIFRGCCNLRGEINVDCNAEYYEDWIDGELIIKNDVIITGTSNKLNEYVQTVVWGMEFVIPEGCKYVASEGIFTAGNVINFRNAKEGDIYYTEDYVYTCVYDTYWYTSLNASYGYTTEHWMVETIDKYKESYADIKAKLPEHMPNGLLIMKNTYAGCVNLKVAPSILYGVRNIDGAFEGCTSLVQAPYIPDSVESMKRTFANCKKLTGVIRIDSNAYTYEGCFWGMDFVAQNFTIEGETDRKDKLMETTNDMFYEEYKEYDVSKLPISIGK